MPTATFFYLRNCAMTYSIVDFTFQLCVVENRFRLVACERNVPILIKPHDAPLRELAQTSVVLPHSFFGFPRNK